MPLFPRIEESTYILFGREIAIAKQREDLNTTRDFFTKYLERLTEESFTAAWRHAVRSRETSQVTATSSLASIAAAADTAARAHLHAPNVPGRDQHSPREQKARPKFPHTSSAKQTLTGKYQVIVYAPGRR